MAAFNFEKLCLLLAVFLFLLFLFPLSGQHHITLLFSSFNPIKANGSTSPPVSPVLHGFASTSINTSNENEAKSQKVSHTVESSYSFSCVLVFKLAGFFGQ
jgi:hypothetical protein